MKGGRCPHPIYIRSEATLNFPFFIFNFQFVKATLNFPFFIFNFQLKRLTLTE